MHVFRGVTYFLTRDVEPLNELEVAVLSMPELIDWISCSVGRDAARPLTRSLEYIHPGISAAYLKKWGPE